MKARKRKKTVLNALKAIGIAMLSAIILFLIVRAIGVRINQAIPKGGINEEAFIDINGTKQWISIYGQDLKNPVLLVLHGGPGWPESFSSYEYQKDWSDRYTVVTWDQRNCGLSYTPDQNDTVITYDLMMEDGVQMAEYLINYLGVEKITLLGYSWGAYFGSNLVLNYPQYFDAYIGAGQLVDFYENEAAFKKQAYLWSAGDPEGTAMVDLFDPEHLTVSQMILATKIMQRYGYATNSNGFGYSFAKAIIFNPYYSLSDYLLLLRYFKFHSSDDSMWLNFVLSDEYNKFSLKGKTQYPVPVYYICGDNDYQTNYIQAKEYFDLLEAPQKEFFLIPDCTHGLMEEKTDEFTAIMKTIAAKLAEE